MFFGNGHLGRLVLQRLDPFDSRAFGSFAQGDCSWAVHTKNSTASHGDDYTPTFYKKLNEDRHPERGNYFRVEWV